jgi:hypothetical protein
MKKDDDYDEKDKAVSWGSPLLVLSSERWLQRHVGLATAFNLTLFLSTCLLFWYLQTSALRVTLPVTQPVESVSLAVAQVVTASRPFVPVSTSTGSLDDLPPCDDPEWCSVPIPLQSFFKFDTPIDPQRWKLAQWQAASGEQVLLREVIKVFPSHFDFLDGDITFRKLHSAMDMFVDEQRDLSPLTAAGRRTASPGGAEANGERRHRRLESTQIITGPKMVNGKLMYPWELEGRRAVPEPYDFRAADRAPVISLGYTAYTRDSQTYFSGNRIGGAFIDRKTFYKHWKKVKDKLEVPFIAVCSLNENWGEFTVDIPSCVIDYCILISKMCLAEW